jgi:hypothetical protein
MNTTQNNKKNGKLQQPPRAKNNKHSLKKQVAEIGPQIENNNDSSKKEGGCINARGNESC